MYTNLPVSAILRLSVYLYIYTFLAPSADKQMFDHFEEGAILKPPLEETMIQR